jgi:hypothetical protein
VATYALLALRLMPGVLSLVLLAAVLVLLPTSPALARRLAVNGSLLMGCAPVLWWVRWPVRVDHGAVVVAAALGALAWRVAAAPGPGVGLAGLLPVTRRVDGLVLLGGASALAAMSRWVTPGSAHAALVTMLPGLDNAAHFHMFATIRAYGATTRALGASPDGSRWAFDDYPQGFHALVATIADLAHPGHARTADALVAYTEGVGLSVVLGTVILTAAIVSLPGLRDRPLVALPAVVATWAAFLWNPGQNLLADGFGNFWLAAAAVSTALLLALAPASRLAMPEVAAVGGLLVFVAHAWAPLLVVAAVAAPVLFHPVHETLGDRSSRRRVLVACVVLVVAAAGVLVALVGLLGSVDAGSLVTAGGGIHGSTAAPAVLLLVVGLYVGATAPALVRRRTPSDEGLVAAGRARVLTPGLVAGLVALCWLLVAQLETLGTISYYFVKFYLGFELVLAAFVPALCGVLLASVCPVRPRHSRRLGVSVALVATLGASQAFGLFPRPPLPLLDAGRAGTAAVVTHRYSTARVAAGILDAARSGTGQSFHRDYLALGGQRLAQAFYPDAWYHAILASDTQDAWTRQNAMRRRVDGVAQAVPLVRVLLRADPRLEVRGARGARHLVGHRPAGLRGGRSTCPLSPDRGRRPTRGRAGSTPGTRCGSRSRASPAPC